MRVKDKTGKFVNDNLWNRLRLWLRKYIKFIKKQNE